MIGRTLGHYTILDKLGTGGMGEVYRAEDTTLKRLVALKVLPQRMAADRGRLERFQREAEALAALDHPNIVHVYSVESVEDTHFLTMQLVQGQRLAELIPAEGLPVERVLELAIPLADALRAAHEKGIVHRDFKPENVMIDEEGRVRILDFGLAKLFDPPGSQHGPSLYPTEAPTELMTEAGVVLGTIPYMSPEQVQGAAVDHRTDIFSFGVVLYEMACGVRPFRGENSASLISSILRDEPQSVAELNPGLPQRLVHTIEKCLAKQREGRFSTARELRAQLLGLQSEVTAGQAKVARLGSRAVLAGLATRLLLATVSIMVIVAGIIWFSTRGTGESTEVTTQGPQIRSLAVLPLRNLSGDPEQDYFVDGMTEALITDLAKISSLRTISRQSVMRYKNSTLPLPELAQELGVEGFIEGSVQRFGGRVKITAQLIQVRPESHLWGESYESDQTDILKLQGEVASAIAAAVRAKLTPEEQLRLSEARPVDPRAYEAYLKGRYSYNRWPDPEFPRCETHFRESIQLQPDFAAAHAGLAACYSAMPWHYPPRDVMPKAREAARAALELDSNLGEAWATLGAVELFFDWDWSAAEESYRRAVELDPNSAWAHMQRMHGFLFLGRFDDAVREARRALALDPVSTLMNRALSFTYWLARRYDDYEAQAVKTLELAPLNPLARFDLANAHALQGMREEVQLELKQGDLICGGEILVLATLGEIEAARRQLDTFQQCETPEAGAYVDAFWIAMVYAVLEDKDESLSWLERAYEERSAMMPQIGTNPALDNLRREPRFQELMRRMNFPG